MPNKYFQLLRNSIMPDISFTTPALLFPAVSLLIVAYTNRFNAISSRIRAISAVYKVTPSASLLSQIQSLRKRVKIIQYMQGFGVGSLFLCVACMFALFAGELFLGKFVFGISLISMLLSLGYSLWEILVSAQALNYELNDLETKVE